MVWRCAECGEPETDRIKSLMVCHHCGKLLCDDDRRVTFGDEFSEVGGPVGDLAYHCPDCYREHHVTTDFAG
jgi:hypothetical protein